MLKLWGVNEYFHEALRTPATSFADHSWSTDHSLKGIALGFSFFPDISIAPLQVHCYSEALPTTAVSELTRQSDTGDYK